MAKDLRACAHLFRELCCCANGLWYAMIAQWKIPPTRFLRKCSLVAALPRWGSGIAVYGSRLQACKRTCWSGQLSRSSMRITSFRQSILIDPVRPEHSWAGQGDRSVPGANGP